MFYGYFKNYYLQRNRILPLNTPNNPTLFQPTIYLTTTPLLELDFNLHKSNSTYLTDLDIARGHHIYCLFRLGFTKYSSKNPPVSSVPPTDSESSRRRSKPGRFYPALGGVTCTFKGELKPYQQYEIWTRVVSWDRKWLYLISYFVEKGAGNPTAYSDQVWRKTTPKTVKVTSSSTQSTSTGKETRDGAAPKQPKIYAICMSKYAFKQGRITVSPSTFLQACELLPEVSPDGDDANEAMVELWESIEEKRKAGLKLAENMAGLDVGLDFFKEEEVVFAKY